MSLHNARPVKVRGMLPWWELRSVSTVRPVRGEVARTV
jgi:hypothetical protein